MTSQVCLVNPRGVALASDSTVSFGYGTRSYPTVNKIFSLAGRQPIGIMISGSATCPTTGLPWERMIGKFREKIGNEELTFQNYVNEFQKSLTQHFDYTANDEFIRTDLIRYFTEKVFPGTQERERMKGVLGGKVEELIPEVKDHFDELNDEKIKIIHEQATSGRKDFTKFEETGKPVDEPIYRWYEVIEKLNSENALEAAKIFCQRHDIEVHQQAISEIFLYHLLKHGMEPFWKTQTKIVFAGFALNDMTPFNASCVSTCIIGEGGLMDWEGRILRRGGLADRGEPQRKKEMDWEVFDEESAHPVMAQGKFTMEMWDASSFMLTYAYGHEIQNIVSGIHPHVWDGLTNNMPGYMAEFIRSDFEEMIHEMEIGDEIKDTIVQTMLVRQEKLAAEISNFVSHGLNVNYSRREIFRLGVSALPMEELCDMAKFLISCESNIMNWTSNNNAVGGPIDVASITKEDGFVWVNTKQIYDPVKNPRHMDIDRPSSNFR